MDLAKTTDGPTIPILAHHRYPLQLPECRRIFRPTTKLAGHATPQSPLQYRQPGRPHPLRGRPQRRQEHAQAHPIRHQRPQNPGSRKPRQRVQQLVHDQRLRLCMRLHAIRHSTTQPQARIIGRWGRTQYPWALPQLARGNVGASVGQNHRYLWSQKA